MPLDRGSLTEISDRAADSVEQDQTARMFYLDLHRPQNELHGHERQDKNTKEWKAFQTTIFFTKL